MPSKAILNCQGLWMLPAKKSRTGVNFVSPAHTQELLSNAERTVPRILVKGALF